MTVPEFNAVQARIDILGKEMRDDMRDTRDEMTALRADITLMRESLAGCKTRCWVGEDRLREKRKFLYNVLAAVGASWLINWLHNLGR